MGIAHLHLLLNHAPTVGTVIALGLLVLALLRRDDHLLHASLEILFIVALVTLPVYLSGVTGAARLDGLQGVSAGAIVEHEDAALWAFACMEATGFIAWIGLWQFKRLTRPSSATIGTVLLLCVLTVAVMARTATLGGEIRHPEIRGEQVEGAAEPEGAEATGFTASVATFVTTYPWVWPAAETLHFIGLCLAVGVILAVNLRILGAAKALPFSVFHRLLPWALLGFGLNLITGMLFFIGASSQYIDNYAFYFKVLFIGLAGGHFLYLTVFRRLWMLKAGEDAQSIDKVVAASGLAVWAGVIFWGRMLPFLGNAF